MKTPRQFVPTLYFFLAVAASFLFLRYLLPLVAPFIVGGFLALLIDPVVELVQKRARVRRGVAVLLVMVVLLAGATLVAALVFARLVGELRELASTLEAYAVQAVLRNLLARFAQIGENLSPWLVSAVEQTVQELSRELRYVVVRALESVGRLTGALVDGVIACFACYFVSKDRREIGRGLMRLVPVPLRRRFDEARVQMFALLLRFIRVQTVLVLMSAVATMMGLGVLGIRYAVILGMVVGLLDLVPVVGPGLLFVPWIGYLAIVGNLGRAVALLVLYVTISVVRRAAEVRLMGTSIGVHPLVVLLAIYVGLRLLGPWGALLGPLVAIVIKALMVSGLLPVGPP